MYTELVAQNLSQVARLAVAIAMRADPKLLVLYHRLFHCVSEGEMLHEVREHYSGAVVSALNLGVH